MQPIPVAAQAKAWASGRLLAGIVGSKPTVDMSSVKEVSATGRSLVQRSPTDCVYVSLSMIKCQHRPVHL
jgi:hypothetical protein